MRGLRPGTLLAHRASWLCRQCLGEQRKAPLQSASYTTKARRIRIAKGSGRGIIVAVAIASLGAGSYFAVTDGAKHSMVAIQRTGRVLSTLFICVNE